MVAPSISKFQKAALICTGLDFLFFKLKLFHLCTASFFTLKPRGNPNNIALRNSKSKAAQIVNRMRASDFF